MEDRRQYYRGLIIQPSEMKRGEGRTETNNGITDSCSEFLGFFLLRSPFYHLKNSFSKMQYLPFNQLPVTKSKGFSDEEGDKTRISLFCPFHVGNDLRKTERKKKKTP